MSAAPTISLPITQRNTYWSNGTLFSTATGGAVSLAAVDESSRVVMAYDDMRALAYNHIIHRPYWRTNVTPAVVTDDNGGGSSLTPGVGGLPRQGAHNEISNVLWADGHVKAIKTNSLRRAALPASPPAPTGAGGDAPFPTS